MREVNTVTVLQNIRIYNNKCARCEALKILLSPFFEKILKRF